MNKYLSFIYNKIKNVIGDKNVIFSSGCDDNVELNKILLSVVLIEKEDLHTNEQYYVAVGDNFVSKKKPSFFYIYLSLSSSFSGDKYLSGIQHLSSIAAYFQSNNSFKRVDNSDMIEMNIDDFTVANEKFSRDKFVFTCKYPFFIYKIGLIPVYDDKAPEKLYPSVKNI